jgi:hypothetical protein
MRHQAAQQKGPKQRGLTLPSVLLGASGRSFIAFGSGRKYLHAVAMSEPIGVITLPLDTPLEPMLLKGKTYPVRRAARIYLRSQISKTDRAKRILRQLARGETEVLS